MVVVVGWVTNHNHPTGGHQLGNVGSRQPVCPSVCLSGWGNPSPRPPPPRGNQIGGHLTPTWNTHPCLHWLHTPPSGNKANTPPPPGGREGGGGILGKPTTHHHQCLAPPPTWGVGKGKSPNTMSHPPTTTTTITTQRLDPPPKPIQRTTSTNQSKRVVGGRWWWCVFVCNRPQPNCLSVCHGVGRWCVVCVWVVVGRCVKGPTTCPSPVVGR